MKGYKGFNSKLQCRGFQYEIGKDYVEERAKCCDTGFHFCENPLDVFSYYSPADSRYCEVEGGGEIDKNDQRNDTKVAAASIHIGLEVGLPGVIKAGVDYIKSKVNWEDNKEFNTGNRSAATNTGNRSAATVEGKNSIACSLGAEGKAKGKKGCWLVLAEWDINTNPRNLLEVRSVLVDGEKIKEDTFYLLIDGQFQEEGEQHNEQD